MLAQEQTFKTLYLVKEATQERPHIVWCYLYEMSRTEKPIETEPRLLVARDWEEGEREMIANGFGVLFWGNENVLELVVMVA